MTKPFLTYDEQIDLFVKRGFEIGDRESATMSLRRLGYYRLSGYWYPFRIRQTDHVEGTDDPSNHIYPGYSLNDFVAICDFDRSLRPLIVEAINVIEVTFRVAIAYRVGMRGQFSHLSGEAWGEAANHPSQSDDSITLLEEFVQKQAQMVSLSKEDFAKHHVEKYGGQIPIWAAVELWDFGTMSRFFQAMREDDQESVSMQYGIKSSRIIKNWLICLNDLRNFASHHQRLNRRHFPNNPTFPKTKTFSQFNHLRLRGSRTESEKDRDLHRLYPLLCIMVHMMGNDPYCATWKINLIAQFSVAPTLNGLSLSDYAIPPGWAEEDLWTIDESFD